MSARNWDWISVLLKFSKNVTLYSSQDRSSALIDVCHALAVPFNCSSTAQHQPEGCIRTCTNIASVFSMNRTGSSTLVPVNSCNESLLLCASSRTVLVTNVHVRVLRTTRSMSRAWCDPRCRFEFRTWRTVGCSRRRCGWRSVGRHHHRTHMTCLLDNSCVYE